MTRSTTLAHCLTLLAAVIPSGAHAAVGAVKVNCNGACELIEFGAVCDTFVQFSLPTAIACESIAQPGQGVAEPCGTGTGNCRPAGELSRSGNLGEYCQDSGPGHDVIVMCDDGP